MRNKLLSLIFILASTWVVETQAAGEKGGSNTAGTSPISLSNTQFLSGDSVNVTFTNSSSNKDWVGLYVAGTLVESCQTSNNDLAFKYASEPSGNLTFSGLKDGDFVAQMFSDDGFCRIGSPLSFSISAAASISLPKTKFSSGDPVNVSFKNSSSSKDWVGLYVAGTLVQSCQTSNNDLDFKFASGTSGSLTFSGLGDGDFVAQLFSDDGFCRIGNPLSFSIRGGAGGGGQSQGDVCFFDDNNFGGKSECFDSGTKVKDLTNIRAANVYSSVQVAGGFEVLVCDLSNFKDCTTIAQTVKQFGNLSFSSGKGINNEIRSIEVKKSAGQQPPNEDDDVVLSNGDVCLFVNTNFLGGNVCYNDGDIVNDLNGVNRSNVFSSVQIKKGIEAVLCDGARLDQCLLLDGDVRDLGDVKFANGKSGDNAITSLQVEAAAVAVFTFNGGWFESAGPINTDLKNPQYLLQIDSPAEVTIDLKSSIDTVLFLVDSQTGQVFKNDDGGIGTNSRISTFLIPGQYTVIAGTANEKEVGAFAISTDTGILDGKHVQFLNAPSQGEENNYYKTVDPRNERKTQKDWLKKNEFDDRNIEEISVNYYNDGDLGLGRELHCRELSGDRVSCTTSNYGAPGKDDSREALEDTIGRKNTLGQVNMEYDPSNLENTVSFYVYAPDGSRLDNLQLDNQHAKTVPGVCLNCHGGKYDEKTNSVKGGQFLAFDLETFRFGTGEDSESAQSESFRKLNAIVRKINPGSDIEEFIDGIYRGKVDEVGGLFDRNYVPPNWLAAGTAIDYTYVIKPYCRGCHIANGESFEQVPFINKTDNDDYVCGFDPEVPIMPHAEMSDTAFWDDITAVILTISDFEDCKKQRFGAEDRIIELQ